MASSSSPYNQTGQYAEPSTRRPATIQPHHHDSQKRPQYPPSQQQPHASTSSTVAPAPNQAYATGSKWGNRARMFICLLLPTYLETLDYTVVATAQPHIASTFNRLDLQSWIGTSYVLTSTVFLPIFGSIADILGRHWAMQLSLGLFIVGSVICTAAQSMDMLLAGRGIAGVGAAGLTGVIRIILADSSSLNEDNFLSTALLVLYALGYSTGPIIGGALLKTSFRWIFAINIPAAVLSSILIIFLLRPLLKPAQPSQRLQYLTLPSTADAGQGRILKETWTQKLQRIDWIGTAIFIGAGIIFLLALSLGSSVEAKGFAAPVVIVCFVIGGTLFIAFAVWEYLITKYIEADADEANGVSPRRFPAFVYRYPKPLKLTEPTIPLAIFKNYDICATSFAAMTGGMVLFAAFYFLAIYFSIVKGLSPTDAGQQLLWFSPGLGIGAVVSLQLIKFLRQPKWPILLGNFLVPISVGLLSSALKNGEDKNIKTYLILTGAGIGLGFSPLVLQARFSQPTNMAATVVSMNLFFRTAGGTIGLAQLSAVLNTKVRTFITSSIADPSSTLTPAQKMQIAGGFGGALDSISGILDLDDAARLVVQDAFRRACQWSFLSLIPWCSVAAILCVFLHLIPKELVGKRPGAEPKEHVGEGEKVGEMQQGERIPPWKTVPTPMGPITLLIWPLRVLYAYATTSRR